MASQDLKTGTKVELLLGLGQRECAKIARWTKACGPRLAGWHIVRFQDGGRVCIHRDGFRVVSI